MTEPTEATPPAIAAPPPAPVAPTTEGKIPYERFEELVRVKSGLESEVAGLREKAATVDTLTAELETWKGKAAEAAGKFDRWQAIAGELGTTDADAIEAVEWQHGRLPAEDRPPVGEWLASIKADPTTAPVVLRPWLAADQPAAEKPPTRRQDATTSPTTGAAATNLSDAKIREVREKAVRTGDWGPWRELSKAMRGV